MEAIVESTTQQNQANGKLKLGKISLTTASALGRAGAQARVARQLADKLALAESQAKLALLQPLIDKAAEQSLSIALGSDDDYRLRRLHRTREQLEQLDKDLAAASDERATKAICDAIARLSEVESNLAMRPKPGSHRPSRPKSTRSEAGASGPID